MTQGVHNRSNGSHDDCELQPSTSNHDNAATARISVTQYILMKNGKTSKHTIATYGAAGNKYQGQRGPTPSRYYRDFGS